MADYHIQYSYKHLLQIDMMTTTSHYY